MEKKKNLMIKIKLFDGCDLDMDATTPNLDELIKKIVENRDKDFTKLIVSCDDDSFDIDSFKDA